MARVQARPVSRAGAVRPGLNPATRRTLRICLFHHQNTMIKTIFYRVFPLLAVFTLSGCWESADVIFHEPGEYHGAADNLTTSQEDLQERFTNQRDR